MKLLTLARDLRRRKARGRLGLFVGEGLRVVEELARSPITVRGVLHTPEAATSDQAAAVLRTLRQRGADVAEVSERDFATAAETDSPQGILAVAVAPDHRLGTLPPGDAIRLLVLDAVQDPGNVGTILRTAAALGATATIALPGTVDLWNAKVVRSAMGAHFHHPAFSCTWEELDGFCRQHGVAVWAADAAGEPLEGLSPPPGMALVMGNEGAGITAATRNRADHLVALPIAAAVESLNVAVAAGILLHALRR
ncbi:MAG: RNA methyltransferase [Gemmatimonadaceae bacterium]|nr:RNA methyltransferase [Gemmatimonadaceae bacterium]